MKEREEESKRLKLQKITEEAEQKRLASEYEQRKNQRILREIEERELEEAQALLQEAEKRSKKKGKKPIVEGVSISFLISLSFSQVRVTNFDMLNNVAISRKRLQSKL